MQMLESAATAMITKPLGWLPYVNERQGLVLIMQCLMMLGMLVAIGLLTALVVLGVYVYHKPVMQIIDSTSEMSARAAAFPMPPQEQIRAALEAGFVGVQRLSALADQVEPGQGGRLIENTVRLMQSADTLLNSMPPERIQALVDALPPPQRLDQLMDSLEDMSGRLSRVLSHPGLQASLDTVLGAGADKRTPQAIDTLLSLGADERVPAARDSLLDLLERTGPGIDALRPERFRTAVEAMQEMVIVGNAMLQRMNQPMITLPAN